MDLKTSNVVMATIPPLYKGSDWSPYNQHDPHSIVVYAFGAIETLSGSERFGIVASLYGSGGIACWFMLIMSVLLSWTVNPASAKTDSLTNDFIAVLSLPVIAAAHFFHQIHQHVGGQHGKQANLHGLFTSLDRDNVRAVAAIEAPLTICEDFIVWGSILFLVAARKGHRKRMFGLMLVMALCLSVELFLTSNWVSFRMSLLVRPFFFHLTYFFVFIAGWIVLTCSVYLLESAVELFHAIRKASDGEAEPRQARKNRAFRPGRYSSWMSGFVAILALFGMVWIKYLWIYPPASFNTFRYAPRTAADTWELDQVVTALGGAMALSFSIQDAFRERRAQKSVAREA